MPPRPLLKICLMPDIVEKVNIVKIGGNLIDDPAALENFLDAFVELKGPKILIHGGGKKGSEWLQKMEIPVKYHVGRRITDDATLEVIIMVYAGTINKNLCAKLQAKSCNALGLSGCDLNIITASKREIRNIDYGWAGDIHHIGTENLLWILGKGVVPVINPITHNGQGQLLNTNADTIASEVAMALSPFCKTYLHYCFEHRGVLIDIHNQDSLLHTIQWEEYQNLKNQGIISLGMIPKLDNAFTALRKGISEITIGDAQHFLPDRDCTKLKL